MIGKVSGVVSNSVKKVVGLAGKHYCDVQRALLSIIYSLLTTLWTYEIFSKHIKRERKRNKINTE